MAFLVVFPFFVFFVAQLTPLRQMAFTKEARFSTIRTEPWLEI
jgi:hypothetical protein